jgi:hypothetical protein
LTTSINNTPYTLRISSRVIFSGESQKVSATAVRVEQ